MTRVLIVDDQTLIRTAVSELVSGEPGLEVIGLAADGREAVELAKTLRPDVVLMDIRMPCMDGIQATAAIRGEPDLSDTRILVLTTFEDDENVMAALRAGASGFIGKGTEADDLMDAIRTVAEGEALLSPRATRMLIERHFSPPPAVTVSPPASVAMLTEREREVLLRVGHGDSNETLARTLFITTMTAKTHVNRIMAKLDLHDRTQLVVFCYESGLLAGSLGRDGR